MRSRKLHNNIFFHLIQLRPAAHKTHGIYILYVHAYRHVLEILILIVHRLRKILKLIIRIHIILLLVSNLTIGFYNPASDSDFKIILMIPSLFKQTVIKILYIFHIVIQGWIHKVCNNLFSLPEFYNIILTLSKVFHINPCPLFFFFLTFFLILYKIYYGDCRAYRHCGGKVYNEHSSAAHNASESNHKQHIHKHRHNCHKEILFLGFILIFGIQNLDFIRRHLKLLSDIFYKFRIFIIIILICNYSFPLIGNYFCSFCCIHTTIANTKVIALYC